MRVSGYGFKLSQDKQTGLEKAAACALPSGAPARPGAAGGGSAAVELESAAARAGERREGD